MQNLPRLALLLALCACAPAAVNGFGSDPDASSRIEYIDGSPDEVWFAMQRALQDMGIPIADAQPGADRGWLVSEPFNVAPEDVHCGARPSGQEPLMRSPVARLHVELRSWSPSRTEAEFRLAVEGTAVEPDLRASIEQCRSKGTLERRILELTARASGA